MKGISPLKGLFVNNLWKLLWSIFYIFWRSLRMGGITPLWLKWISLNIIILEVRDITVFWNKCGGGISAVCHGCGSWPAVCVPKCWRASLGIISVPLSLHLVLKAQSPEIRAAAPGCGGHATLSDDCSSSAVPFTHLYRRSDACFVVSLSSQCRGRLLSSPHDGEESSCSREDEGAGGSRLLCADTPALLCGCKFRIIWE